jgi:hypothetical protein
LAAVFSSAIEAIWLVICVRLFNRASCRRSRSARLNGKKYKVHGVWWVMVVLVRFVAPSCLARWPEAQRARAPAGTASQKVGSPWRESEKVVGETMVMKKSMMKR